MKVYLLRNVLIGGRFFAEGTVLDLPEKESKAVISIGKGRAVTREDAEKIEKTLREDSEKALAGKLIEAPEDKGGKKK